MNKNEFIKPALSVLFGGLVLSAIHLNAYAYNKDISNMFEDIRISDGQSVGDLSGINNDIELGDNVIAEELKSVNGDIEIGADSRVEEIKVVNGDIVAGYNFVVENSVASVNGDILFIGRLRNRSKY